MDIIERCFTTARAKPGRIVLPEGNDPRIAAAARQLADGGLAQPILLGKADQISAAASDAGISLDGIETFDPATSDRLEAYAARYREGRSLKESIARRMVKKPLFFGGMMVACGDAATMVAGVANATATVIQAGVLTVGYAPGIETASSFFLMLVPSRDGGDERPFIFADCAVNVQPTAEQLADIAIASAGSAASLLEDPPRTAMLSFSTRGSAAHADVEKVATALRIARDRNPELMIDGEFQADSAIVPAVAAKKAPESSVAGNANTLIFPDLNTGNICYKLTERLAKAGAYGPIIQGCGKPVNDLSRGCSVDDIVTVVALTSLLD